MDKIGLKFKNFLSELLFPSFCLGCQKEGSYLCQDCKSTMDISGYNYCLCSMNPIRIIYEKEKPNGKCYKCKNKKLSGLYSALPYKENFLTKKIIYQFKYPPYTRKLSEILAKIMIEHLVLTKNNTNNIWENGFLIPVPMEINKQKRRGYNQSEEISKELSKVLKIPVISNVLIKTKNTPSQATLSKENREENLKEAFLVKNPTIIKNKKIFLVDDIYTTGSTMEECANVLRTSRAQTVWGVVFARES